MTSDYFYKLKDVDVYLDFFTAQMWYKNQWYPINLPRRPLACLQYLSENINGILTPDQIYDHIWGSSSYSDVQKAVRNAISKINPFFQKMLASIDSGDFSALECVTNVYGMGYRVLGSKIRRCDFDKQHTAVHNQSEKSSNELLSPLVKESAADTPFAEVAFNMHQVRTFASCGMEESIFKLQRGADDQQLCIAVNFEKTRFREVIPEYAGAYFLQHPPICATSAKQICFQARSEDGSIETLFVEIKPKGRAWMHESFSFALTPEYKEHTIALADFVFPETLKCLEEVTFVLKLSSFANENDLTGKLEISNLVIR